MNAFTFVTKEVPQFSKKNAHSEEDVEQAFVETATCSTDSSLARQHKTDSNREGGDLEGRHLI